MMRPYPTRGSVTGNALGLHLARLFHPAPNLLRWLAQQVAAQFFVLDARHGNVNVDPDQMRTLNAFLTAENLSGTTGAFLECISILPAWARILSMYAF